jgi:hypothetical protein
VFITGKIQEGILKVMQFRWMAEKDAKKLDNQTLLEKTKKAYNILKQCEVHAKEAKEDYGKQKIAQLRVDFITHQLDIFIKECSERGISINESSQ